MNTQIIISPLKVSGKVSPYVEDFMMERTMAEAAGTRSKKYVFF